MKRDSATRFEKFINSTWPISLVLFGLALLPRLPDLDRFLTADEFLWVDRSRIFLAGLTNSAFECTTVVEQWIAAGGLACTLRTGHPGVTTMWTGSFGLILRWLWDGRPAPLHDYVVAVSTNPLDASFIAPERLGTVLLTSLWVVAVYWLVRHLLGSQVALLAGLLTALDPFHIALSRVIHHDALNTVFMTLSALTMLVYWGQAAGRKWLLLSGVLAGFGFLSKSPALFLMPFVAAVGLWFAVSAIRSHQASRSISQISAILLPTIGDGLLWFAVAAAVFVIFWPAMWVIPRETLETVFFIGSKYATGGHAKGNFFWGEISKDPGPLFYVASWLYRASPMVILGLIAAVADRWRAWREQKNEGAAPVVQFRRYAPLVWLFIVGYFILVAVSEKKQERYFLPAYPWFNLVGAVGLAALTGYQTRLIKHEMRRLLAVVIALLVVNGGLVAFNHPYYFTYYNPLFGGIRGAEQVLTIGWGEGLDLAADYLNQKEDGQTRVASWYQSTFAPYYKGEAISYSKEKGKVLAGDYAVFYINQTQRRFPDDIIFDYFEARFEPEQTITLHGLDYAWIYPSLGVDHYIEDQTYTGIASLLAWQWRKGDQPLIAGQAAEFELYWEYLGKQAEEAFFFRLVDRQGRVWTEGTSLPVIVENPPVDQWREGEIILERGSLVPPPDMPPGQYQLQIGFYTEADAVAGGELLFLVPADESLVSVAPPAGPPPYPLPETATVIDQPLVEPLTLLGAGWPSTAVADGSFIWVDLYWRVEQPLPANTILHLGLMDAANEPQQAWFNLSLAETFNRDQVIWQPGQTVHTVWQIDVLDNVPSGMYTFQLVWPDDIERTLEFGELSVVE